jgi:hypothetical protein
MRQATTYQPPAKSRYHLYVSFADERLAAANPPRSGTVSRSRTKGDEVRVISFSLEGGLASRANERAITE